MSEERLFGRRRWARLGVESIAVVVSILLAFAIDAGWDRYQAGQDERAALERLLAEFEGNRAELEFVARSHRRVHDFRLALLAIGYGTAEPTGELAEHMRILLGLSVFFDASTGVAAEFDAIVDGLRRALGAGAAGSDAG